MSIKDQSTSSRRELELKLDMFERNIAELKVIYEQYFLDLVPFPPDKQHQQLKRTKNELLKAPV